MGDVMDAEVALAVAVILQAIKDVRRGTPKGRERALVDIADGGLDYWIELVCCEGYSSDVLRGAVHALA